MICNSLSLYVCGVEMGLLSSKREVAEGSFLVPLDR